MMNQNVPGHSQTLSKAAATTSRPGADLEQTTHRAAVIFHRSLASFIFKPMSMWMNSCLFKPAV